MYTVNWLQVLLCIINNTIRQSFVYTQLNGQTVLFLTIQFSISYLFAHSLNVKQFYLTHRLDSNRCYHSELEWTLEQWQWRDTPHSLKLQDWSLTIRLFSIISRTLIREGSLSHLCRDAVGVFYSPSWLGSKEILPNIVKLVTVVEGDPKAPFSIATTPRRRGGHYSFPWIAPLYPWYVLYIAEC